MRRALISVTDKSNIIFMVDALAASGYQIISTGGTLKHIRENAREAIDIEEFTGFPEMFEGRIKTLHPKVHGGLLYKRGDERHLAQAKEGDILPIDVVIVNLYDFEGAVNRGGSHDEIVENIDIGGPSMIRSSAKNYKDVLVVVDPQDYPEVAERIRRDELDEPFRQKMAMKAFAMTAYYDAMISSYFTEKYADHISWEEYTAYLGALEKRIIPLKKVQSLRYGENPHQRAAVYNVVGERSYLSDLVQLGGKELSYNNINDLNTAVEICADFTDPDRIVTAVVKHASPCAVALGEDTLRSYERAYEADSLSIFGGVIATNGVVDRPTAEKISEIFVEIVAAKDFTDEALAVFSKKSNLRIIKINYAVDPPEYLFKHVSGKMLLQSADFDQREGFEVVTDVRPTEEQKQDLLFAMKVAKFTRSNAVVFAKDLATVAIGGGQTSRIWAVETALNNYRDKDFSGAVMASDAFFPFDDCIKLVSKHNIAAVIQPGGAIRDQDSIDACNQAHIAMVFTGTRHFKH